MFSSPCRVLDTLFHLISPRFCEVDENLASGRPGDLPESHSEEVAGLGFRSCLTFCAAGRGGGGPQGLSSLHLPTPSVWGPLIWGKPQELLRAQGGPLPAQDPAWWETDAPPPSFPLTSTAAPDPDPTWAGCRGGETKQLGGWACPLPTKSSTPSASGPLGQPREGGKLRLRTEGARSRSQRAPELGVNRQVTRPHLLSQRSHPRSPILSLVATPGSPVNCFLLELLVPIQLFASTVGLTLKIHLKFHLLTTSTPSSHPTVPTLAPL